MITIIEKLDGTQINLLEQGIITLSFDPGVVEIISESIEIPGRAGRINTRMDYGNRRAKLNIMVIADNVSDTRVKRDLVSSILDGVEPYYIYESDVTNMYGFELPGQKTGNYNYKNVTGAADLTKKILWQRTDASSMAFNGLVGTRTISYENYDSPFWNNDKTLL